MGRAVSGGIKLADPIQSGFNRRVWPQIASRNPFGTPTGDGLSGQPPSEALRSLCLRRLMTCIGYPRYPFGIARRSKRALGGTPPSVFVFGQLRTAGDAACRAGTGSLAAGR